MAEEKAEQSGPDLAQGIALSAFTSETLLGHVGDQDVLPHAPAGFVEKQIAGVAVGSEIRSGQRAVDVDRLQQVSAARVRVSDRERGIARQLALDADR